MTPNLEMFKDSSSPQPQSRPHFLWNVLCNLYFFSLLNLNQVPCCWTFHLPFGFKEKLRIEGNTWPMKIRLTDFFQVGVRSFFDIASDRSLLNTLSQFVCSLFKPKPRSKKHSKKHPFHDIISWASLPFDRQNEWSGPAKASIANISWLFGQPELAPLDSSRPSYDVEKPMYVLMHAYIGSTPHPVTGTNEGL